MRLLEVELWCDGKCLTPKATSREFEFGNQSL